MREVKNIDRPECGALFQEDGKVHILREIKDTAESASTAQGYARAYRSGKGSQ